MGFGSDAGVQREAVGLGHLAVVVVVLPSRHGLQGKRLLPGLGSDGDTVGHGMAQQIIDGGVAQGLKLAGNCSQYHAPTIPGALGNGPPVD